MAEQGKKDVTKDLQDRTDPIPTDKLLMVNGVTKEVQQIELEKLGETVRITLAPVDSANLSDI